jgi:8-amino-7-oxononanoate synthase
MTSKQGDEMRAKVFGLVSLFRDEMMEALRLGGRNEHFLLPSPSPIQAVICPGNEHCIAVSKKLRALGGIGVFPIRSPTVPKGEERIRIIVHAHNTKQEVLNLVECLIHFTGEVNDGVVNENNRQERLLSKL